MFLIQGQQHSGGSGGGSGQDNNDKNEKRERPPAPPPPVIRGRKRKAGKGPEAALKLPAVTPHARCRLKLLKMERIQDWLLMEEEFLKNCNNAITAKQEREENQDEERNKVDDLRGEFNI